MRENKRKNKRAKYEVSLWYKEKIAQPINCIIMEIMTILGGHIFSLLEMHPNSNKDIPANSKSIIISLGNPSNK